MPPVAQQGSRAGLISALVIFVILFVTTTILFIYQTAETRKRDDLIAANTTRYGKAVSETTLSSPEYSELTALAGEGSGPYANMTAIEVAMAQRDALARSIVGAPANTKDALGQYQAALNRATRPDVTAAGVSLPKTAGLAPAVARLTERVIAQAGEAGGLNERLAAAQKETQGTLEAQKALLAERDAAIKEISEKYNALEQEVTAYRTGSEKNVVGIQTSATRAMKAAQNQAAKLVQQVTQLQSSVAGKDQEIRTLQTKLADKRTNVKEPIVQAADGKIVRLPGNGMAYINLGSGDQISPGMTFEVYDQYTKVPALGDTQEALSDETKLPVGKASVEVVRVSAGSSECRVIRKTGGQEIVEGDLISNVVYDAKTKYNFVVYGNFDLDQNGTASSADAEIVKRLITQWGGNVQAKVTANVDFVVMGKEPEVPELTEEERQDPVRQKELEEATAASEAYANIVSRATELHIPIMNQNRFLYFSGYYAQAGR